MAERRFRVRFKHLVVCVMVALYGADHPYAARMLRHNFRIDLPHLR
jgi:hypothetical protein